MTKDERSSALDRRKESIVQLVQNDKTVREVCDLLGLDPENEPKYLINPALAGTGLTVKTGVPDKWNPIGLKGGSGDFRHQLRHALECVLDCYCGDYIKVAQLTGLTQKQQKKATSSEKHDWTISQLQRLADALGITFAKLMHDANQKQLQFKKEDYGRNSNRRKRILGGGETLP